MRIWSRLRGGLCRTAGPAPRSARRPAVEALEDRCVPSASPPALPVGLLPAVRGAVTPAQARHANVVIDWNSTALLALWNDSVGPTVASRDLAMVQVAVYDAVDAIEPVYRMYPIPKLRARPAAGASPDAAAVGAAERVLMDLFPDQAALLRAEEAATLARLPDGPGKAAGLAFGRHVADALVAWRSHDGSDLVVPYVAQNTPGAYQLTPPGFLPYLTPQWGFVTPWAMRSGSQFRPGPPPAPDSAAFAADVQYTEAVGDVNSTVRTPEQTLIAHFWADVSGKSVTPPGHMNEVAQSAALSHGLGLLQDARLFALLNIAEGDAGISCWDTKYFYHFWRPITAIRDPGISGVNSQLTANPKWTSLWVAPPFPSYTSGHSTFSGAMDTVLTSFFGPNTGVRIGSDDLPGVVRSYTSFTQAANEAGQSRVLGGIHYETDNVVGLMVGREVGLWAAGRELRPLRRRGV